MNKINISRGFISLILITAMCLGLAGSTTADASSLSAYHNAQLTVSQPQNEDDNTINIKMVGDVLLHDRLAENCKNKDGSYSFNQLFYNVKDDLAEADLALVNQEVIIGGADLGVSGYPCFNAPFELGDALVTAGFNVVLHATNHCLDKGKKGIVNCLDFWETNYPDMPVLGIADEKKNAGKIYYYTKDDITVAVLNYTYGTNGIKTPSDMPWCVNYLDETQVKKDLKKAKKKADFIIACPHWGTEYRLTADASQEKWAKIFAENGADLIIGTHPHVIEPVEWVGDTLCYYSLGNFVNWTSEYKKGVADRVIGLMADVTIGKNEDGKVEILSYDAIPLVTHLSSKKRKTTVYKLEDYTSKLAEKNEIKKQDSSFSYKYCKRLVKKVLK